MAETTSRKSKPKVTSLRERIPALRPAQAQALRRFFGAPQRWFLEDGGLLVFTPGDAGDAGETFSVDADGTALSLRLESGAPRQAGLRWSDYSGRSRMLAWSLAHEPQLMRLSEVLGLSLLPTETPPGDDAEDSVWLGFSIDDEAPEGGGNVPARTRGAMRMPAAWLERVLARAEPVYADDPLPELGHWVDLTAPVSIGFAGPQLTPAEWSALRPGDVILAGNRRAQPAFEARASGRAWPLAPSPDGWRVQAEARTVTPPSYPEPLMTNEQETPVDGDDSGDTPTEDHPARHLPVQLTFDIGQIELSVGDLASLQPGYVFALPAHLEGANVTIRANGNRAGRGEVVAVGDTLGVRLLSWG